MVRGTIIAKITSHTHRGGHTLGKQQQRSSPPAVSSEPHIQASQPRIQQGDWGSPRNPTLQARDLTVVHRTAGNRYSLGGTIKVPTPSRQKGAATPRRLSQNHLLVPRRPPVQPWSTGAQPGDRALAAAAWEGPPWA